MNTVFENVEWRERESESEREKNHSDEKNEESVRDIERMNRQQSVAPP